MHNRAHGLKRKFDDIRAMQKAVLSVEALDMTAAQKRSVLSMRRKALKDHGLKELSFVR